MCRIVKTRAVYRNQSLDTPLDVYSQTSPSSSRGGAIYGRDTLGLRR